MMTTAATPARRQTFYPDTTPPNAPSGLQFSSDGKTVTGTAEPGSTITLKDADGNVIGTGKTGSDGNFTISRHAADQRRTNYRHRDGFLREYQPGHDRNRSGSTAPMPQHWQRK
jgi:hypothetical protein